MARRAQEEDSVLEHGESKKMPNMPRLDDSCYDVEEAQVSKGLRRCRNVPKYHVFLGYMTYVMILKVSR